MLAAAVNFLSGGAEAADAAKNLAKLSGLRQETSEGMPIRRSFVVEVSNVSEFFFRVRWKVRGQPGGNSPVDKK